VNAYQRKLSSLRDTAQRGEAATQGARVCDPLCSARKTLAAFCLSLPARNERGESRREGKLSTSSPRPSPPFLRRRGRESAVARSKQIFCRTQLASFQPVQFLARIGIMNLGGGCALAIASWTAAVLCRFCAPGPDRKAPGDWRSPKPGGTLAGSWKAPMPFLPRIGATNQLNVVIVVLLVLEAKPSEAERGRGDGSCSSARPRGIATAPHAP